MRKIVLALALACAAQPALAQQYPARSVRIIVPFGVGGPADICARFIGARLGGRR